MKFDEKLRMLMASRNMTAADLAERVGVSAQTVGRWMKGTQSPRLDESWLIVMALRVEPNYLFDDRFDTPEQAARAIDDAGVDKPTGLTESEQSIIETARRLGPKKVDQVLAMVESLKRIGGWELVEDRLLGTPPST